MRADRLIQIVLLLQKRQTITAHALAEELGVSRRTIFRDIDALCTIGIPVYAEHGPEGGYRLVEDYRTSLKNLTHDELSALLAFSFPQPLGDLEIGQKLKTALLKLYAVATPKQPKIYLDWTPWGFWSESVPHLQALYRAVQESRSIVIHYRILGGVDIEREVEPYGLVAKAGVWYVVYTADGRLRYHRVSELIDVKVLEKQFVCSQDFDLEAYWTALAAELDGDATKFKAVVRVSPAALHRMPSLRRGRRFLGEQVDSDGWLRLVLCFESFEAARKDILALGSAAQVLEPESLRLSVQDFAAQILQVYG